jgi:GT2 family glycosyltransferase
LLPDLSIVIPSYNRSDLLRACLHSVTRNAPLSCEIIVVDDGSPNASASAIAAEYTGVRALRLPSRRGFCVAANSGIAAARGRIVELLNDDTEATPGWANAALARFYEASVGAVAPLVLCWPGGGIGEARIDSAGDCYFFGGIAGKRCRGEILRPQHLTACRVFGASASSAFYRRDVVQRIGAFPPSFGAYFEDVDLSFRLRRVGYEIVYEPASRVLHHVSASHGQPNAQLIEQQSRNEERLFWRNLPTRHLLGCLPAHAAVLLAKAWRRWREGNLAPYLRGRMRAFCEAVDLIHHRREMNRLGPAPDFDDWLIERRLWKG